MLKTKIIFLALIVSWFVCSEGPNNDVQVNEKAIKVERDSVSEAAEAIEESGAQRQNSIDSSLSVKRWVKL